MIDIYKRTPVEKVLLFKEEIWNIFNFSETKPEAIANANTLAQEQWWGDSWHLQKCLNFLMIPKFYLLLTYTEDPGPPRSGHSETLVNVWRQIEIVRRGFKTRDGRLSLLKLFQITRYLPTTFVSSLNKSGQTPIFFLTNLGDGVQFNIFCQHFCRQ